MNAEPAQSAIRSGRAVLVVRLLTVLLGAALISLAFSDDVRIAGGPGFGFTELLLLGVGIINVVAGLLGGMVMAGWLLCQVSVAATLLVAEFALRATVGPRYTSPFQLHDRYLYELVPGARREYRHLAINGGAQLYQVNSLGFRGAEFAAQRTAMPRVAVYGDSFIQAEYTALEHTLSKQLADRLTAQLGQPVEVINAGVAGYGPDQVLRRLQDELDWLQPDLLIVAVFTGNDYGDLLRNKLYRLGDAGELLENPFVFSDEIELNAALEKSAPVLRKMGQEVKAQLQLRLKGGLPPPTDPAQQTVNRMEQHIREYREYIVDGDNIVRDLRTDPYSADIALQPDSPSARYKLKLMDAVVAAIQQQARAHDVPLLLVAVPHPMDVMGGAHASGAVDQAKFPDYQPTRMAGGIQAIAERHGIDTINLLQPFQAADDPAALYLLGGDDHWNNAGQALAAELIAKRIQSAGYLQKAGIAD